MSTENSVRWMGRAEETQQWSPGPCQRSALIEASSRCALELKGAWFCQFCGKELKCL